MATYKLKTKNDIKFICILDREVSKALKITLIIIHIQNTPLMFFNFEEDDKELEHQYQIISALEIINYKKNT